MNNKLTTKTIETTKSYKPSITHKMLLAILALSLSTSTPTYSAPNSWLSKWTPSVPWRGKPSHLEWNAPENDHTWKTLQAQYQKLKANNQLVSKFQWGIGGSAYQIEGSLRPDGSSISNNWTEFEQQNKIEGQQRAGFSTGHWKKFCEDIDIVAQNGFTDYRMSIEWARIYPNNAYEVDYAALEHYQEVISYARSKNIQITLVFWHHTWPTWFSKIDAFAKPENNEHFLRYVDTVSAYLHGIQQYIPFNEPDGYVMKAYYKGDYPPCERSMQKAGEVLKNMLNLHVDAAKIIRKNNPNARIGITQNMRPLDPFSSWNPVEVGIAYFFDKLYNDALLTFFEHGKASWYMPGMVNVTFENSEAKDSINFFGVNYYSHTNIRFGTKGDSYKPGLDLESPTQEEAVTDTKLIIYPEGLERVVRKAANILKDKEIIIMENGVGDNTDKDRDSYIRKHLFILSKVLRDPQIGPRITGYHYWSLLDNFEWSHGFHKKYGLIAVDMEDQERTRTVKEGAKGFFDFLMMMNGF